MNKKILLINLINEVKISIEPWNHSKSTKWQYDYSWMKLQEFFEMRLESYFNENIANEFIVSWKNTYERGECKKWKYYLMRYTTQILIRYYNDKNTTWFINRECKYQLLNYEFTEILKQYIISIENEQKSKFTCAYYSNFTRYFLKFIEDRGTHLNHISQQDVADFIIYIETRFNVTSIRTVLCVLRSFFKYLEQEKLIKSALSLAVPFSASRRTAVIRTLTTDEERRVLNAINEETSEGKRNKAIILIAMRLGLRMLDILNLKFQNIDWNHNTLFIVQHKTGNPLQLPLLSDVGNAIATYILYGRPSTIDVNYIFIRHHAPYCKLTQGYDISSDLFHSSGVNQKEGDKKGLHVFRHSLASRLLTEGTPLPTISSILGHIDQESTKVYISTDERGMKKCPLSLHGIELDMEVLL